MSSLATGDLPESGLHAPSTDAASPRVQGDAHELGGPEQTANESRGHSTGGPSPQVPQGQHDLERPQTERASHEEIVPKGNDRKRALPDEEADRRSRGYWGRLDVTFNFDFPTKTPITGREQAYISAVTAEVGRIFAQAEELQRLHQELKEQQDPQILLRMKPVLDVKHSFEWNHRY